MNLEITAEQLQAALDRPVRVTDPNTNQPFVILPADVYERMALTDDELTMAEVALLVERTMADDDVNDPHLASYQQYGNQP